MEKDNVATIKQKMQQYSKADVEIARKHSVISGKLEEMESSENETWIVDINPAINLAKNGKEETDADKENMMIADNGSVIL